ncbi:helix-turn-helix domain-containing protein [Solibacillus sp. MA9]|uniref:Helix-turn-helix domain-containing protein n=1 Tax=Solibacillus palustris TaxID=2908203 RepID=A0ABS9UBE0_9BACL|nr:helix-turn-helix domain-containing protein [Solibacillus sp. MA9]
MIKIGEKIKLLRKERKMTLAQVAGDRLSKGMLSLIENGKAQPSMESLQHIAKQLGIDVSELMQTKDTEELKEFYLRVEALATELKKIYEDEEHRAKCEEIYSLVEPYILEDKLTGNTFEEIRLTDMYHFMRYYLEMTRDTTGFESCIERYKQISAHSKVVKRYGDLGGIEFNWKNYENAINWMLQGVEYIEQFDGFIGEIEKLDLYYNLTVIYAAHNNEVESEKYLQLSLKIAHEKKILYRINDFYRYLFFMQLNKRDGEKAQTYLDKIRAFSVILQDPLDLVMEDLLQLAYWNHIEKDYERVISIEFNYRDVSAKIRTQLNQFLVGEQAYAHYQLQQVEEAFALLPDIIGPELYHHPLDAARIYRSFAIRALCYLAQGDVENAKRDILYAANGVKDYASSLDKTFIEDAYTKIMKN